MKIKALPSEERPMEKGVYFGVESLSNTELLALIINTGTQEKSAINLAQEVIGCSGGVFGLRELTVEELTAVKGIGKSKAIRIMASLELGKRMAAKPTDKPININHADQVAAMFMEELRYCKKENFKALLLNAKGDILSVDTVSVGELTSTLVHPREVFCNAVKKSAAAVILVHNHPSGDPTPSKEDIETTLRLKQCGEMLGINVLDHLIIGDGRYISIKGMGQM